MTKKQQLEYLLNAYKKNEYKISTFCDEFTRIFFQTDWDSDAIPEDEKEEFKQLAFECERYTPFKDDLLFSKYFIDDVYIHNKIIKVYNWLKEHKDI